MHIRTLAAAALAALVTFPALAMDGQIVFGDAYARTSRPDAPVGAAFMMIMNKTGTNDRLIAASSDIAERVELHTHLIDANGVARMVEVEDGFAIPAGGAHALKRGGDHVMFMGLRKPLKDGDIVKVTFTFEVAGDVTVNIPVDMERAADGSHSHGGVTHSHDHGGHTHSH
ncbi:MAG: copper chaperone PCu(A)C [Pseudomonadota bacterium]